MATKKIYIVEDDSIIKMLLRDLIISLGHQVVGAAATVEVALNGINSTSPDLIILDITLQGQRDGVDLARIIKNKWNIPFIYVTGNSDTITLERANTTDPLGFILKPFDEKVFTEKLENFLDSI